MTVIPTASSLLVFRNESLVLVETESRSKGLLHVFNQCCDSIYEVSRATGAASSVCIVRSCD
jgi:hypothetical protein